MVQRMPCVQAPEHLVILSSTRYAAHAMSFMCQFELFKTFSCLNYGQKSRFTRFGLPESWHADAQDPISEAGEAVIPTELVRCAHTSANARRCGEHMTRALASESRKHYASLRAKFGSAAPSCPAAKSCGSWDRAQLLPPGSCGGMEEKR